MNNCSSDELRTLGLQDQCKTETLGQFVTALTIKTNVLSQGSVARTLKLPHERYSTAIDLVQIGWPTIT
jgi:hypothetical protein